VIISFLLTFFGFFVLRATELALRLALAPFVTGPSCGRKKLTNRGFTGGLHAFPKLLIYLWGQFILWKRLDGICALKP